MKSILFDFTGRPKCIATYFNRLIGFVMLLFSPKMLKVEIVMAKPLPKINLTKEKKGVLNRIIKKRTSPHPQLV